MRRAVVARLPVDDERGRRDARRVQEHSPELRRAGAREAPLRNGGGAVTVETQLRALAETASAEQRPVSAKEAIAQSAGPDRLDDPSRRRVWMLVAAIALLVGGLVVLLAWDRSPGDEPLPVVSIPQTLAPDTTLPDVST